MEKQFFENKVRNSLAECLRKDSKSLEQIHTLACAVSGGADSIAMLSALKVITKNTKVRLLCVNVNHNIRPVEQTLGDSKFVEEFCSFIGVDDSAVILPTSTIKGIILGIIAVTPL